MYKRLANSQVKSIQFYILLNLSNLHKIVHSLSRSEKSLVRKVLSSGGKKDSKYVTLFNDLLKAVEIDETNTQKIRSSGLKRPDQFHLARHTVLERIVSTLAQASNNNTSKLSQIKVAFHLEAFSYANQLLIAELGKAQELRQAHYLLELFDLVAHLKGYCKLKIDLPKETVLRKVVEEGMSLDQELKEISTSIRSAGYKSAIERQRLSQYAFEKVEEIEGKWLPNPCELTRVQIRANLLVLEFGKALEIQEELTELSRSEDLEFSVLLRDLELLLRLLLECGHHKRASGIAWEIAALEPITVLETSLHYQSFVRNGIFLASVTYDSQMIEAIWLKLVEGADHFAREVSSVLFYYMALIYFSIQNYPKAKKALSVLATYKRNELKTIHWQFPLLRLATHIELNEVDLYESLLRSADNQAKESGIEYPRLLVAIFRQLIRQGELRPGDIDYHLNLVDVCWRNPSDHLERHWFNAEIWLRAKVGGTSMAEIELQEDGHKSTPLSFHSA